MKKALSILLSLTIGLTSFVGCSSGEYPSHDIQFYVNADAGGGTDAICRKVAQMVEENTGATFYIVNKPGVADSVGPSLTMDAKPDGYTICNLNYGSVVTAVYEGVVDNYSMDRLKPIALITEESDSIVASKDAPFSTFDEMIAYAKEHPGEVRVGDQGIGSRVNLTVNMIEDEYGVEFNKVSYISSAPQREALLNGEVDVILSSLGDFNSIIESGDAVPLVEFSEERNPAYPDVPTCLELGMGEEYVTGSFIILAAPAGTPDEITDLLQDAFQEVVESDEFVEWTQTIGVTPHFMPGDEVVDFMADIQEKDFAALDELNAEEGAE